MRHSGTLPPFSSATDVCSSDSARLYRLRSSGDVSVEQTRAFALFSSFYNQELTGRGAGSQEVRIYAARPPGGSPSDFSGKLCTPRKKLQGESAAGDLVTPQKLPSLGTDKHSDFGGWMQ